MLPIPLTATMYMAFSSNGLRSGRDRSIRISCGANRTLSHGSLDSVRATRTGVGIAL